MNPPLIPAEVEELSKEEGRAILDARARSELGMTLDEFIARWDARLFEEITPAIGRLAMLLPLAR